MRIEKISDTQIQVTLNHTDLRNRNIKISELAYGSIKTQALFRDMMTKAFEDFGFETDNTPLMIEAVPLSTDSIRIIVTKVQDPSQIDEKLDTIGERPTHRTFKTPQEDRLADLELMKDQGIQPKAHDSENQSDLLMYVFKDLDDVCGVARRISPLYFGDNSLYKYDDRYFLILNKNQHTGTSVDVVTGILGEFGATGTSNPLNPIFLKEHGKLLIKGMAIEVLCKYL